MNKKLLTLLVILMLAISSTPVAAAGHSFDNHHNSAQTVEVQQSPVIFEDTITVTEEGGRFSVGFVTLEFKKNFVADERLPITFDIRIFVQDGVPGIEINPSTNDFEKKVIIRVDSYEGLLYNETWGKNVKVDVKKQVILAEHFSWYRFR